MQATWLSADVRQGAPTLSCLFCRTSGRGLSTTERNSKVCIGHETGTAAQTYFENRITTQRYVCFALAREEGEEVEFRKGNRYPVTFAVG